MLRSTAPDNVVATSLETAVVSIPEKPDGQVLALVEKPGEPSKLITVPEPQPAPPLSGAPQRRSACLDCSEPLRRRWTKPAAEPEASAPAETQPPAEQPASRRNRPNRRRPMQRPPSRRPQSSRSSGEA